VTSLPKLLTRRPDELPLGPFDAQHRGHLVGDRQPRDGPLVVLAVLARTAVVEVGTSRHLARLQDLEVIDEELNWGPRQQPKTWPGGTSARGRRNSAMRHRRPRVGQQPR
jgi:hypothetical protein